MLRPSISTALESHRFHGRGNPAVALLVQFVAILHLVVLVLVLLVLDQGAELLDRFVKHPQL